MGHLKTTRIMGNICCRSCGSSDLQLVIDLGNQPLANNLLKPEDLTKPEPKFPLEVHVCAGCWLMQITHIERTDHSNETHATLGFIIRRACLVDTMHYTHRITRRDVFNFGQGAQSARRADPEFSTPSERSRQSRHLIVTRYFITRAVALRAARARYMRCVIVQRLTRRYAP